MITIMDGPWLYFYVTNLTCRRAWPIRELSFFTSRGGHRSVLVGRQFFVPTPFYTAKKFWSPLLTYAKKLPLPFGASKKMKSPLLIKICPPTFWRKKLYPPPPWTLENILPPPPTRPPQKILPPPLQKQTVLPPVKNDNSLMIWWKHR